MLRLFGPDCPTTSIDAATLKSLPKGVLWIDLFDPSDDEVRLIEKLTGIEVPGRDELEEIEPSSRYFQSDSAAFMTLSLLHGIGEGRPGNDPVGFILTDRWLVTVRFIDPKPFIVFAENLYAQPDSVADARGLLVRLLDTIVDRMADEFEIAGNEIEAISRHIFQHHTHRSRTQPERRLEALLMRIGKAQLLLAQLRESSVSATRLLTYLASIDAIAEDARNLRHVESLIADAQALNDHSNFLGDNLVFLLDASLGLISLEQNQVMKLFSIFAVIFMPPTLVAGVYGMNFDHMPELRWLFGYPYALVLMLMSAVLPYWFARRKGWL